MNNKKTTKRALISSLLSLALCMSMLIGTTFAWFTDSVTSGNNKIQAGTLDVQLLMKTSDEGKYEDISDNTNPIFGAGSIAQNNNAETLWEPGKTQVAYLAIKNGGTLDLKYTVGLEVTNVNKDLYKVMEYAIIPDAQYGSVTSWTSGNSVVEGTQSVSGDVALKVGETHYFALAIHMDENANNDYQGGEVDFDLTVLATQLASESDSFDNTYDNKAVYEEDTQLEAQPWRQLDVVKTDTVVDGGGNTFAAEYQEVKLGGDADITIKGVTFQNGLTLYTDPGVEGTITLENCTIYLNDGNPNPSNEMISQHHADCGLYIGAISPNVTYVFKNCNFKARDNHVYHDPTGNYYGFNVYIGGNYSADSITFEGCDFEGSAKSAINNPFGYISNENNNIATYYNLTVTGCDFIDWNNNKVNGNLNGAAIRGNVPASVLETYNKTISITGNTFGNSNGSEKESVVIDGWTGTWN